METLQYQVGGSLTRDAPSYVVRTADHALYEALRRGEFCYVLNSRQMGKSSLMVQTRHRLQAEGYRCATLDLTNIGSENITPLQWYKGIVKDLWRSFKLLKQVKINDWWKDEEDISLLQRLSYFIEDVLLKQFPHEKLIIFVDEVDSILSLPFSVDDFFALIRFCYNQRATNPEYQRINFVILGVATPADLIRDRTRTPFNIGTPIELTGFTPDQARPLAQGLVLQSGSKQAVLHEILYWTNGQPFLTQKLCQLAVSFSQDSVSGDLTIPPGNEAYWVEQLVIERMLKEWESQDEPEHLRTIRNRLLNHPETVGRLFGIYQRILGGDEPISDDDSREQMELLLSGLVIRQGGRLRVKNPIYAKVFNVKWVEQQLSHLRPYAQSLEIWLASGRADESRLLRGQALKDAQLWSQGKRLGDEDYQFLSASVESDREIVRQTLEAERRAAEAEKVQLRLKQEQQASNLQRRFLGAVSAAFFIAVGFGAVTFFQYRKTQRSEIWAIATAAEGRFESHHQLEAIQQIIAAKTKLQRLHHPPQALSQRVTQVLQRLLDGANAMNQLEFATEVVSLDIHPQGDLIGIVTLEGELSFWHPSGERAEPSFLQAADSFPILEVEKILFSPDGTQMAIALKDNRIQLWSLEGRLIKTFDQGLSPLRQWAFEPTGQQLLIKIANGLNLLNLESGRLNLLAADYPLGQIAMSPQGDFIASTYRLASPKTIDAQGNEQPLARSLGFMQGRRPPRFSFKGDAPPPPKHHLSSMMEQFKGRPNVQIWDRAGEKLQTFPTAGGPILALAISPTDPLLATAHVDGEIRLTKPDGEPLPTLLGLRSQVRALAFSPDGQRLAAADSDGGIHLWNVGGSLIHSIFGHRGGIHELKFSPDGTWLVSRAADSTVRLWKTGHSLHTILAAHTDAITGLAFSHDGQQLRSFSVDQRMNTWQRNSTRQFQPVPAKSINMPGGGPGIAFSANGKSTAVMSGFKELRVSRIDGSGPTSRPLPKGAKALALSAAGDRLAIGTHYGEIQLWDISIDHSFSEQPQQVWSSHDSGISALAWSPTEALLAVGSKEGTIELWQDNVVSTSLDAHRTEVSRLAFSPDGRWLASASKDKTIKIWHRDGTLVQTLSGHRANIKAIAFSPDSQRLASTSEDSSIKLWQIGELSPAQNPLLRSLTGHVGTVNTVAFSPDGTEIATAGGDRKVMVWNIKDILALDEVDYACNHIRNYLRHSPQVPGEERSLCD